MGIDGRAGAAKPARAGRSGVRERTAALERAFRADHRKFQYRWVEFLIGHLVEVSQAFGGDLQQMMLLALVGQVRLNVLHDALAAGEDPASLPPERFAITASRLADVSGIPRETVRRKLGLLEARGWVVMNEDRAWRLATDSDGGDLPARRGLEDIHDALPARVARFVAQLESLADGADAPEGARIRPKA